MYQESGHGLNNNSLHRTASLAICVKSNLESESYIWRYYRNENRFRITKKEHLNMNLKNQSKFHIYKAYDTKHWFIIYSALQTSKASLPVSYV